MPLLTRAGMALAALILIAPAPRARAAARSDDAAFVAASAPAPAPVPAAAAALAAVAADSGLRPEVLELALRAHERAVAAHQTTSPIMTVIDYSLPSRERRLWVLDLVQGTVLARALVAHGKGTGDDIARNFSDAEGSYQSSLGTFVTGETYQGKHGLSLRLKGLDQGLNSHAEARGIVVHAAEYVNQAIVGQLGRLGRSQGCPALNPAVAPRIIGLIKGGTVVFSYFPSVALRETLDS